MRLVQVKAELVYWQFVAEDAKTEADLRSALLAVEVFEDIVAEQERPRVQTYSSVADMNQHGN